MKMRVPQFLNRMGIRGKLIAIFVAIKVVPLVLLAWYAWQAAQWLAEGVSSRAEQMADVMRVTQRQTGKTANDDAVRALDERSREAIESLSTDVARQIADFLYDRDKEILQAASIEPSESAFRRLGRSIFRRWNGRFWNIYPLFWYNSDLPARPNGVRSMPGFGILSPSKKLRKPRIMRRKKA